MASKTLASIERMSDMSGEEETVGQGGGINITGGTVSVAGDMIGRDKVVGTEISTTHADQLFHPLTEAVRVAPTEARQEALQIVEELKREAAEGKNSKDSVIAKLVDGLVGLVSSAVGA